MKEILVYLENKYADWELAYILPQIIESQKYSLTFVNTKKGEVCSMGGIKSIANETIDNINDDRLKNVSLLILPGGMKWADINYNNGPLTDFIKKCLNNKILVAAICDATTYLAANGFLNDINHTGLSTEYIIKKAPDYKGEKYYIEKQCVVTDYIVTANGTASLEFTFELAKILNLWPDEDINEWYQMHKNGFYHK